MSRVRCSYCGGTYDLLDVEVVSRYADCSTFKAPCCDRIVDDRRWVGHFREIPKSRLHRGSNGHLYEVSTNGEMIDWGTE